MRDNGNEENDATSYNHIDIYHFDRAHKKRSHTHTHHKIETKQKNTIDRFKYENSFVKLSIVPFYCRTTKILYSVFWCSSDSFLSSVFFCFFFYAISFIRNKDVCSCHNHISTACLNGKQNTHTYTHGVLWNGTWNWSALPLSSEMMGEKWKLTIRSEAKRKLKFRNDKGRNYYQKMCQRTKQCNEVGCKKYLVSLRRKYNLRLVKTLTRAYINIIQW